MNLQAMHSPWTSEREASTPDALLNTAAGKLDQAQGFAHDMQASKQSLARPAMLACFQNLK